MNQFVGCPIVKIAENRYILTQVEQFLFGFLREEPETNLNRTLESSAMASREQQLRALCDHHRIDLIYAFGSRACEVSEFLFGFGQMDKGNTSDVDLGVKPSPLHKALSVREKVEIAAEIEDLLGVGRVDLVILSETDPFLSANIVRGERIFCRDPYAADEYELYILRRAGDLAPLEMERLSLIFTKAN